MLIASRVVQGVGAGILAPLGFAITAAVFPIQERGKALATIAVVALAASASGPAIGGAIVEFFSWEWIFIVNIPLGILGIVLARRIWPETYDLDADRRIDYLGMALLARAVFCLTFGLVDANHRGWTDGLIALPAAVGGPAGGRLRALAAPRRGDGHAQPAANKQFVGANIAMFLFAAGRARLAAAAVADLREPLGLPVFEAALALLPVPVTGILVWPKIAKAADSRPPRELAAPALLLMAVGLLWFSFTPSLWDGVLDYAIVFPGLVLIGIGMGTGFPTINVGAMGAVQGQELGLASGILNTSRQLGAAIGVALLIATFSTTLEWHAGSARRRRRGHRPGVPDPAAGLRRADAARHGEFAGGSSDRGDPARASTSRSSAAPPAPRATLRLGVPRRDAADPARDPVHADDAALARAGPRRGDGRDAGRPAKAGRSPRAGPGSTIRPGPAGAQPAG